MVGAMGGLAYGEGTLNMGQGDTMILFTDGVTEAMNRDRELYGESRLEALLAGNASDSVQSLVDNVLVSVREFADEADQSDDITLLAFRYDAKPVDSDTQRLDLSITNELGAITDVAAAFEAFAERHRVPPADLARVNLVFDEILSNIISYGYEDDAIHEIHISVELTAQRLVVTIEDDGIPFNPFARKSPDTTACIEERPIGGLGIHLVQQVMDSATYQRRQNANVVIFSKEFEQPRSELA